MKKQFLTQREQMAFVGVGMWALLAFWTLSAFWAHIDHLAESYRNGAKAGAMAGEFALVALILWHCFNKHLGVRRWSLILGFVLAGVILVHAGALRGIGEAKTSQIETEKRLAGTLTEMSREQAAGVAEANQRAAAGRSQKERLALANKTNAQQGDIAKAAQEKVASVIVAGNDKVKDVSILPRWYLDGWCYSLIFIVSLAFVGVIFLLMMNTEDIDANFDGIVDSLETKALDLQQEQEAYALAQREAEALATRILANAEAQRREPEIEKLLAGNPRYAPQADIQTQVRPALKSRVPGVPDPPVAKPVVHWRGGQRVDEPRGNGSH